MSDWTYRAQVERVVDGDTIDLLLDLGFKTYKKVRIRLDGVDTAETYGVKKTTDEYKRGKEQTEFVEKFLQDDAGEEWPIEFESKEEAGKYGRWIGDVRVRGNSLADAIVQEWPSAEKEY